MNLILLEQEDFLTETRVRLSGRRYQHACSVLDISPGQNLQVGLLGGKLGCGVVSAVNATSFEMQVKIDQEPPKATDITVILAMPRPKAFKRIIQGLTALGIKQIIVLNTWKVDKSYWQSPALQTTSIREQFILGLEQARDTILPKIQYEKRFKPFVEDKLPELITGTRPLVAHPGVSQPCPTNIQEPATLAIGPEGGFTDYEVQMFINAGFSPIHLGHRALRVETAVPALLGRLLYCS